MDVFNCRHAITLEAMKSPFGSKKGDKLPTVDDLILAIRVCSTPNWADAVYGMTFWDKVKMNMLRMNVSAQVNAYKDFMVYLEESTSFPKVWVKTTSNGVEKKQELKKEDIPSTLALVVFLMSKLHISEQDAWNMPFAKAVWYTVGFASQESGDVSIISTEEEERSEDDKKLLEEIERKAMEALKK